MAKRERRVARLALRDRARISSQIAEIVAIESKHGTGPDLEGRVRARLERQYGETPTWMLILELLIRLLPLLLEKEREDEVSSSDLAEEQ
jgi:hypothetical protein